MHIKSTPGTCTCILRILGFNKMCIKMIFLFSLTLYGIQCGIMMGDWCNYRAGVAIGV